MQFQDTDKQLQYSNELTEIMSGVSWAIAKPREIELKTPVAQA